MGSLGEQHAGSLGQLRKMTLDPTRTFYIMMADQNLKQKAAALVRELKKLHPDAKIALKYGNNWELLVAVELSAQCTDKKVNEVTAKLFKKYRTLDDYVRAKPSEFENDIHSTGFYRNKTKNILAAAKLVKE